MIEPERLAAFVLVTATTSLLPGPSMLFVMNQAIWRGPRSGVVALAGMQLGYIAWWVMAGLGLGTLAAAFPLAFRLLALAGALYLGWLGLQALRHSGAAAPADAAAPARKPSNHAMRDGIMVAIGNPKALVYIVALLPPFVDAQQPVAPQLLLLAVIAMVIDVLSGSLYIAAGGRLSAAMSRPAARRKLDIAVGALFMAIAAGIIIEQFA
ncbi:MAG: LysE family translocator [Croceibacterium sp.]